MITPLETLMTQFLEHLEIEKNRSQKTIRNYDFYLSRFLDFAQINKPSELTQELVRKFRLWLNRLENPRDKGELKKSTQNYHIIALRSFLKYMAKRDIKTLSAEKLELAKAPERQISFLEGSDLERLLEAPLKSKNKEIIKLRDKAILELLFATGLRVSELTSLKRDSLNFKKDEFTIRGKGSKLRVCFLSNQSKYWVEKYLKARQDTEPYLFVSHDKAKNGRDEVCGLTPRSVQRLVSKYARAAGITKKVTTHTLRHSYATDLLTAGADIRSVQSMLGHSSITTTQIYTHLTDKQLRETYQKHHDKQRKK